MHCKIRYIIFYAVLAIITNNVYASTLLADVSALSNLSGASSFEDPVRNYVLQHLHAKSEQISVDSLGNVIAHIAPYNPKLKTVLVLAHMDEIGYMITNIDDRGYIRVAPLGGISQHVVFGQSWRIQTKHSTIRAVSGLDSPHVLTDFTKPPKLSMDQFFLDTGLSKDELLAQGVRPGLSVVPDSTFKTLGHYYEGKALDDRVGVALLISLFNYFNDPKGLNYSSNDFNLVFAFSTQEEVGMRGAKALAMRVKPDVVLNIEAGIAHDYPMQFGHGGEPELGKGPTVFVYEGSMLPNQELVEWITHIAKKADTQLQWESEVSYGQDGSALQQSGYGCAAINLGIPIRYAHSHHSVVHEQDIISMSRLLQNAISSIQVFLAKMPKTKDLRLNNKVDS